MCVWLSPATSSSVGVCVCVAFVAVAGRAGYGPVLVVRTSLPPGLCLSDAPARRTALEPSSRQERCRQEQPCRRPSRAACCFWCARG